MLDYCKSAILTKRTCVTKDYGEEVSVVRVLTLIGSVIPGLQFGLVYRVWLLFSLVLQLDPKHLVQFYSFIT